MLPKGMRGRRSVLLQLHNQQVQEIRSEEIQNSLLSIKDDLLLQGASLCFISKI